MNVDEVRLRQEVTLQQQIEERVFSNLDNGYGNDYDMREDSDEYTALELVDFAYDCSEG